MFRGEERLDEEVIFDNTRVSRCREGDKVVVLVVFVVVDAVEERDEVRRQREIERERSRVVGWRNHQNAGKALKVQGKAQGGGEHRGK